MERATETESGHSIGSDDSAHDCFPSELTKWQTSCRDYTMGVALPGGIKLQLMDAVEVRAVKPELEFWRMVKGGRAYIPPRQMIREYKDRHDDREEAPAEAENEEVASETLAKIYEAQKQYAQAADVYEKLAQQSPDRAAELRRRAEELRQRAS